ncbi:MAG: hypothetical protein JXR76_29680 [Deltaproteobacteria bacterium]|nr:hypothetical protein [Deltaproteobacteria bacterium]
MGRLIKKSELKQVPLSLSKGDRGLFNALDAQHRKTRIVDETRAGLIEAAMLLAMKIVSHTITLSPSIMEKKYREAILEVASLAPGIIRIHPQGAAHTNIESLATEAGFQLQTDSQLHPADCIIETADVTLTATVDSAVYHFKKLLSNQT